MGTLYGRRPIVSLSVLEMTNSYTAKNSGKVLAEADIDEDIIYAQISKTYHYSSSFSGFIISRYLDPETFKQARSGIPVTVQRRFDVYPDVSKDFV